ncbi:MAG: LamG-like jellyroll fold domain-containing protein [Bacteroidota bacterium]
MKKTIQLLALWVFCSFTAFSQGSTGLVAHWDFNGSVNDVSGHALNGINFGAVATAGYNNIPNTAYQFNGTSSYIRVPNDTLMNVGDSFSVCALVRLDTFYNTVCQGQFYIFRTDPSQTYTMGMAISDNAYDNSCSTFTPDSNVFYTVAPGSAPADPLWKDTAIVKHRWYCVVGTYAHDTCKLYVNGALYKSVYWNSSFSPYSGDLYIGKAIFTQYPYFFSGTIDDMRLYHRVLSGSEANIYCDSAKQNPEAISYQNIAPATIELSPNPVINQLNITLPTGWQNSEIQILNAMGQVVYKTHQYTGSQMLQVDMSQYPVGMYILQVQHEGMLQTKQILKN